MRVGSLFSGIGGLDLGLERAGMSVAWQCESDPYCRAVLAHHWPGLHIYEDIRDIEDAEPVDLVCGGFPCQPVSLAGKGLAQEDPRWLWPEFARVVGFLRPRYVLVENVPGLVRRGLADVVGDLAAMGYDAEWQIVSAASVGAPHLRERLFVVAYPDGEGEHARALDAEVAGASELVADADRQLLDCGFPLANTNSEGLQGHGRPLLHAGKEPSPPRRPESRTRLDWHPPEPDWEPEPDVGRVADGVPNRVAQLRALGNAVVPQVAEYVGRLIIEAEELRKKGDPVSFWDTHEVSSGGGYLSPDEKEVLVTSKQPFEITGIKYDQDNKFGPRFVLTLSLPDPATGDSETRLVGFPVGSGVTSRDDILQAMLDDHFGAGQTEPIPAILSKGGNSYLVLPAPQ